MWCSGGSAARNAPDLIVNVVDATNLRLGLRLSLELLRLGRPMIVALNLSDIARKRGMNVDPAKLAAELGCPVVETVAVQPAVTSAAAGGPGALRSAAMPDAASAAGSPPRREVIEDTQREVRRILDALGYREPLRARALARIDGIVMHPVAGPALLLARAVPDVPGRVQLGRAADGPHQRRCRCAGRLASTAPCPTGRCAACWSTA